MSAHKIAVALALLALACAGHSVADLPEGCPNWPNPDQLVVPIYTKSPRYPPSARQKGITGYVMIAGQINRNGTVRSAEVVESVPPGVFDASAVHAYRAWRYCPLDESAPDYPNPVVFRISFDL